MTEAGTVLAPSPAQASHPLGLFAARGGRGPSVAAEVGVYEGSYSQGVQMNIAIVGSRIFGTAPQLAGKEAWALLERIFRGIEKRYGKVTIVSGGANGVDKMAAYMARNRNHQVIVHKAQWDKFGKSAGYKRNELIVEDAEMVVAIMRPGSKGTRHTVHIAMDAHKPVRIFDAASGDELPSCPCDDDETHTRLKNEHTYQTVLIDGADQVLAGENPREHRWEQDADNAIEMLPEGTCGTCGREAPEGNCLACANEVYGDGGLDRFGLERNAGEVTPDAHPDITGQNFYTVPEKPEWTPNPFIRGTFYRIVNGHRLYTVRDGARIPAEELAAAEERLNALPAGQLSFDTIAKNALERPYPVGKFHHAPAIVKVKPVKPQAQKPLPKLAPTMLELNAAILAYKSTATYK